MAVAAVSEKCFYAMKDHAVTFAKLVGPLAIDLTLKAYTCHKHIPQLKEICTLATAVLSGKPPEIHDAYQCMSDGSKKMLADLSKKIITEMKESNLLSKENRNKLQCDVNKCQQQIGRSMVWQELIGSGILIATQIYSVRQVWLELSNASNLTEKSRKQIPEINETMNKMNAKYDDMCSVMDQLKMKDDKDISLVDIMCIQMKNTALTRVYTETRIKISSLQIEVGGQTRTLEVYQKELIKDGIVNFFQVAAHVVEFIQLGSSLTGGLKYLKMGTTAIFGALAITKAVQYSMTSDRLKELQKVWKDLDDLDKLSVSITVTIEDAELWLASKIEQLQLLEAAQN